MEVSINMTDKELPAKRKRTPKRPPKFEAPLKQQNLKPKKKVRWYLIPIGIVVALVLSFGIYMLYKTYKLSTNIGFQFTPGSLLNNKDSEPELKKDSTGKYTNVMIIGIDTRGSNSGLMNTDSIMVASYNYDTKDVSMISIPRDLHVQISPNVVWYNKINSVYATAEQKEQGSGLERLKTVVEQVTGMEIQYYGMIDYQAFVQLIDTVGGVDVNVENSFTDNCYPATAGEAGARMVNCLGEVGYWKKISFTKGVTHMDGATALEYARSRHSGDNGEGSDFARAKRQQRVIIAFKDALLSSETLLNPKKITELMSAVQDNVKISTFTLDDIQAGVNALKDFENANGQTHSFVLDPYAGNQTLLQVGLNSTMGYYIVPRAGEGNFNDIHDYVNLVLANPSMYEANPSIYVYNTGLGYQDTYNETQKLREEFKYMNIKFLGTLYSDKTGTYVYTSDSDKFGNTVDKLATYLNTEDKSKPEYITTGLNSENITILLGKAAQEQTTSEVNN